MAFRKLGEFIKLVDIRNSGGNISNLLGVSISKEFMPSVANIIGTDLTKYKIISKGQFACSLMQVSRDGGIAISLYKNAESAIMSPAYFIFEVSNSQLNSDYLELIFNTSEFDRAATFYAVGGVRGTLTWDDFCKMEINVPDIAEQERVVKIYNTIQNRIKILNALNKNLEEQAQTIFKNLVSHLDNNGVIGDYCSVKSGFAFKNSWWVNSGIKVIKIGSINQGYVDINNCSYISQDKVEQVSDIFKLFGGDLLIALTGATLGKFAIVPAIKELLFVNQRVGKFLLGDKPLERLPYIYCLLKQDEIYNEIINRGTGTAQSNISPFDIMSIPCVLLEECLIKKFNIQTRPMFKVIINNQFEILKLAKLRELLLPKLLS